MPSGSCHRHLAQVTWLSTQSFPTDSSHFLCPHQPVHADCPASWGRACSVLTEPDSCLATRQRAQLLVLTMVPAGIFSLASVSPSVQ